MTATLHKAPGVNFGSTSLNGAINDSVTTITLNSTTNLNSPGYLVIDRQDSSGANTPLSREVVSYTGVSGSDVTGVTRASDGSTARSHLDGALVEPVMTIGMWNDLGDFLAVSLATGSGALLPLSTATITNVRATNITGSVASISTVNADTIGGIGGQFYWSKSGALATSSPSVAGDTHYPLQRASKNLTINSFYGSLLSAPSLNAFQCDISYGSSATGDFSSIFSTEPTIDVGEHDTGSAATAAVLSLTSLASGALVRFEIDAPGDAGVLGASLSVKSR